MDINIPFNDIIDSYDILLITIYMLYVNSWIHVLSNMTFTNHGYLYTIYLMAILYGKIRLPFPALCV